MSQAAKVALASELVSRKGQAGSPPTSTKFPSVIDALFTCCTQWENHCPQSRCVTDVSRTLVTGDISVMRDHPVMSNGEVTNSVLALFYVLVHLACHGVKGGR